MVVLIADGSGGNDGGDMVSVAGATLGELRAGRGGCDLSSHVHQPILGHVTWGDNYSIYSLQCK
jgi:hypothetical protein